MTVSTYIRKRLYNTPNILISKYNSVIHQKFIGDGNMKKTMFILLCLTIISLAIASVSAIDNETMTDDSIQTIDQQHISVDTNGTNENDLNDISVQVDNNTTINVENTTNVINVTDNAKKTVENNGSLNIPGPRPNQGHLDLRGPKIEFTPMEKDILKFAEVFKKNIAWSNYHCMKYVLENTQKSHYTWKQVALIIARAHNIAIFHSPNWCNTGKGWYKTNLTVDEVYLELMDNAWFFVKTIKNCPKE